MDSSSTRDVKLAYAIEITRILNRLKLYDRTKEAARAALTLARDMAYFREEAVVSTLIAEVDLAQGKYESALAGLIEVERLCIAHRLQPEICEVHLLRGNLAYHQDGYKEALAHYLQAYDCARANALLGVEQTVVINIGSLKSYTEGPEEAIRYYMHVLAQLDSAEGFGMEADVRANIGLMYSEIGEHERALIEFQRAMDMRRSKGDTLGMLDCMLFRADAHLDAGRYNEAMESTKSALALALTAGVREREADAEERMHMILEETGDLEGSIAHLKRSHLLRDSLSLAKRGEVITSMEIGFETEKKEQALALSQANLLISQEAERSKRAQRNWLIGLSAVLVLLAVVLYRNYNAQKRMRTQERVIHDREVNDLLKRQEISSLEAMMKGQEQERQRVGKDLHDRIGSMLSAVKLQFSALEGRMEQMELQQQQQYQHVFDLLDETVSEVRRISHDMVRGTLSQFGLVKALEDLRSAVSVPGKLSISMSVFGMEDRLDQDLEIAVYRMVQECVSNVMKHAHAKELSLQLTRTTAALNIIVEDDGAGFDLLAGSEGMGLGNIRERAKAYHGVVNVDSRPGHGTTVSIDLPLMRLPDIG